MKLIKPANDANLARGAFYHYSGAGMGDDIRYLAKDGRWGRVIDNADDVDARQVKASIVKAATPQEFIGGESTLKRYDFADALKTATAQDYGDEEAAYQVALGKAAERFESKVHAIH